MKTFLGCRNHGNKDKHITGADEIDIVTYEYSCLQTKDFRWGRKGWAIPFTDPFVLGRASSPQYDSNACSHAFALCQCPDSKLRYENLPTDVQPGFPSLSVHQLLILFAATHISSKVAMSVVCQTLSGRYGISISSVIIAMATVQVSARHVKGGCFSLLSRFRNSHTVGHFDRRPHNFFRPNLPWHCVRGGELIVAPKIIFIKIVESSCDDLTIVIAYALAGPCWVIDTYWQVMPMRSAH